MVKRLLFISLLALSIWPLSRFCHHQTKGFSLSKIEGNTTCIQNQKSPPLTEEALTILTQKFTYLDRGLQSYSFVSEDGKTVLKLFNNHYQRRLFWLRFLPGTREKIAYNLGKWKMTFSSYDLAYNELKKETGLIAFHPKKSTNCPIVTIVDNIGIEHLLNLSNYAFALQKKASLAFPYLRECAKAKDWGHAQKAFSSLVKLLERKMELGIADRDPLIRTNIGFIDGEAMQIDIGPFSHDESLKKASLQKEEINKITLSLKHWIENNHPELFPYFYEAIH